MNDFYVGISASCAANVITSVTITMVNRELMSQGMVSSQFLTLAQGLTALTSTIVSDPAKFRSGVPHSAFVRLALLVGATFTGITMWNLGLGHGTVNE